jgi:hypothetical protein
VDVGNEESCDESLGGRDRVVADTKGARLGRQPLHGRLWRNFGSKFDE